MIAFARPGVDIRMDASMRGGSSVISALPAAIRPGSRPVEKAGTFGEAFVLRGDDSVQLTAVHALHEQPNGPLTFACDDRRLNQVAQLLQLEVLP